MKTMKGYKVFSPDWTCNEFQFEVGKTFTEDVVPICCDKGFHFCTKATDCFSYYAFDPNNKVAEVEALGDIDTNDDDSKCSTNKIHIIREIPWQEVLDLVNIGNNCTGLKNSGNNNSGNENSGSHNSGNGNSGDCNNGNGNSGDFNSGDCNSGSYNSGDQNNGNRNSGNYNSGHCNSGNQNSSSFNSGNHNSGDFNSGNYNSGTYNTGSNNSGSYNSGNHNSGDWNDGNYNSGDFNSGHFNNGDWNKTDFSNGCFNTEEPKMFMFNKPSNLTHNDWLYSKARDILLQMPLNAITWVFDFHMTDDEKKEHPEFAVTGGYLKYDKKETENQAWWDNLSTYEKDVVMNMPNFDGKIFEKITGIKVTK